MRGFCPSCVARRMTALTAHLTDDVFPAVRARQWVLSLPHRVRYLLAWDHELCRAVVGVFLRAVMGFLRDRARARGIVGGRSGAVAVVQRFGAALNLNVHALVLDRIFTLDAAGAATFRQAEPVRAPRRHAHRRGFDLHAAIVAPAGHARRLERLCRYALRPPVAEDRLQVTSDEHVVLRLRHR